MQYRFDTALKKLCFKYLDQAFTNEESKITTPYELSQFLSTIEPQPAHTMLQMCEQNFSKNLKHWYEFFNFIAIKQEELQFGRLSKDRKARKIETWGHKYMAGDMDTEK